MNGWVLRMSWEQLLFAHWPVPAEALRALIPAELELDTFEGQAWLGVVPFRMNHVAARFTPEVPGLRRFLELNVRTYVRHGKHSGVWFFSLDATSWLCVRVARMSYSLPYFDAAISSTAVGKDVHYKSERQDWRTSGASLDVTYGPTGPVALAQPGTLEHWLVERYSLFAQTPGGQIVRGVVEHTPWPLQPARAEFAKLDMTAWMGVQLPDQAPLLHYSEVLHVKAGRPKFVG